MAVDEALLRWLDSSSNVRDLQITPGSDGGYRLSVTDRSESVSVYSEALSINIGSTIQLYNQTLSNDLRFSGFWVSGETDGLFTFKNGSSVFAKKRINIINKDSTEYFKAPIFLNTGDNLIIEVTNIGIQTANFECIFYTLV